MKDFYYATGLAFGITLGAFALAADPPQSVFPSCCVNGAGVNVCNNAQNKQLCYLACDAMCPNTLNNANCKQACDIKFP